MQVPDRYGVSLAAGSQNVRAVARDGSCGGKGWMMRWQMSINYGVGKADGSKAGTE